MKPKLLIIDLDYYPNSNANISIVKRISLLLKERFDIVIATQNTMNAPSSEKKQGIQICRTPFHSLNMIINVGQNGLDDYIKLIKFKLVFYLKKDNIDRKMDISSIRRFLGV